MLKGRNLKILLVLSIVVPVGLFAALRLSGVLGEPVTVSETITLDDVELTLERPSMIAAIDRKLESSFMIDGASFDIDFLLYDYHEPFSSSSGDLSFDTIIVGNVSRGHIQSVYLVFHENSTESRAAFLELKSDVYHQTYKFENMSIVGYAHYANMEVAGDEKLEEDEKAFIRLSAIDHPRSVYVRAPTHLFLPGQHNQTYHMVMISEVVYFNGTIYKKIVQPFSIILRPDGSNSFETAEVLTAGEYGENPMLGLGGDDLSDFYKINLTTGERVEILMEPPPGANFELFLYDPTRTLKIESTNAGSYAEFIDYTTASSGWWFVEARWDGGGGFYTMSVNILHEDN